MKAGNTMQGEEDRQDDVQAELIQEEARGHTRDAKQEDEKIPDGWKLPKEAGNQGGIG
jgi:hypothetical protein